MTRVNRNIVTVLKVLAGTVAFTLVWLILTGDAWTQELEKYQPIAGGFCGDVQLNCIKMIPADTDIFYAVFKDGKIIAITRVKPDGKEETIWGKLPLRKGEQNI